MGKILLTGGTGYIGSHTAVELISAGFDVVIADNLSNSSSDVIDKIEKITGTRPIFYEANVCCEKSLDQIFTENQIDAVIHFAAYKAVGESVEKPLMYYDNNLGSAISVLKAMEKYNCKNIIFSSSATVYGSENVSPFKETDKAGSCTNPYGQTKLMIEQILSDFAKAHPEKSVVILRYFNPIGAHSSRLLSEQPKGVPNNLMPYIVQVSVGKLERLNVFGADYDTPDGTGVRDYIHVVDLAKGHVAALRYATKSTGVEIVNLGTGHGTSVLEMVKTFEDVTGAKVPYVITDRRSGDIASCYAGVEKAYKLLGWKAELTVGDACKDSYLAAKER